MTSFPDTETAPRQSAVIAWLGRTWPGIAGLAIAVCVTWRPGILPSAAPGSHLELHVSHWIWIGVALAIIAAFLAIVASLLPSPPSKDPEDAIPEPPAAPRFSPGMAMMLLLALAVAVLGAMAVLQLGYLWHDAGISQMRAATASAQGNQADAARNVTHLHAIGLGPTLLLGAAAGVMMGFALLVIAANRPWERLADWLRPRPRRQIAPATELATAMTAAIHDLETESDPRAAVIACYRRCESALTSRRHRRHQAETPREFLQAAVATTRLPPFPVRALLTVFERARFSELPITASDRAVALSALGEIRSTLEQEGRDGR